MPVIIHSREIHPFLPSLGSPLAIDRSRAEQQDPSAGDRDHQPDG
jgi:homoserine O-succinyltransferase/O-acetyltransferase